MTQRLAKPASTAELADWENSEALTRVIPQAAELAPRRPAPPPARPPAPSVKTQFLELPPPQANAAPTTLDPSPAAPTSRPAGPSPVRRASLGLMVALGALLAFTTYRKHLASTKPVATARIVVSAPAAPSKPSRVRPVVEARAVDTPSVKEAASAFARGDYREALAQYRALAQLQPSQEVYRSLIRILEQRLTAKSAP